VRVSKHRARLRFAPKVGAGRLLALTLPISGKLDCVTSTRNAGLEPTSPLEPNERDDCA